MQADPGPMTDLERERRRLLERDAEWAALSAQGSDLERILSFWTDDARVYPPGLPVVEGKAALGAYVQGALSIPGFHITWTSSDARLSPDGRMACVLSTNAVTMPGSRRPIDDHSRASGDGLASGGGR